LEEKIRKFEKSDYEEIINKGYSFSERYLLPKKSIKRRLFEVINKILGKRFQRFTIVMEKAGNLVGSLTYYNFDNEIWVTGPLFVVNNARGMGVGKKLVSAANEILREKGVQKTFGDVPINNPAKYLHTKLGCLFYDFTYVIKITKKNQVKNTSTSYNKPIRKFKKNSYLFEIAKNILSKDMIEFFNITEKNYYIPFDSNIRKIARIFFKPTKYIIHNNSLVFFNVTRFKPILNISIYLDSLADLDIIFSEIKHNLKIDGASGRVFFKQSIDKDVLQKKLDNLGIIAHLNETMVYLL